VGDGRQNGFILPPGHVTTCSSFLNRRVQSYSRSASSDEQQQDALSLNARNKYRPKSKKSESKKLTRLQAVQQLFFASVNRTVAYDHAHRISLILFSNEVTVACKFTPLFDTFRNSVDCAVTGGDTRLFDGTF